MTTKQIIITTASVGLAAVFAATAFAQTTTTPPTTDVTTKITCVGAAVNTRETALDTAMTSYTGSINSAYAARAAALKQAYTQTSLIAVKNAVKTAWSDFNKSVKSSRKTWVTAKNSAWSQYRTAAVACKAPAGTGDGANSGLEVVGQ